MIDRGTCKAMLRESARLMLEQADRLSDIDSKFGDGDHGITITKIAKLMDERAEAWDEESIKDFLDDLGMAAMAVRGGCCAAARPRKARCLPPWWRPWGLTKAVPCA